MARTALFPSHKRETKAAVNAPAPAPASNIRTTFGRGPNTEAINKATGAGVRNWPSTPWRSRVADMAAFVIGLGYQTEPRFATEQIEFPSLRLHCAPSSAKYFFQNIKQ